MVDVTAGSLDQIDTARPAVSWPAIFSGAVVGAAVGILLFILGVGFGLLAASPASGASATGIGVGAAIWLVIIEWVSAGIGGYVAGRLRTKWVAVHTHEVFFRDTAHGLVTWALGTVIVFGLFASTVGALVGGATGAATQLASGAMQGAAQVASSAVPGALSGSYFTDMLFRPSTGAAAGGAAANTAAAPAPTAAAPAADATTAPATGTEASAPAAPAAPAPAPMATAMGGQTGAASANTETAAASRGEASQILLHAVAAGNLSDDDRTYLASVVASQTGLSTADAQSRVDAVMGQVKDATAKAAQVADNARKAAATASLLAALALLIGAFVACVGAAIGGKERDEAEDMLVVAPLR